MNNQKLRLALTITTVVSVLLVAPFSVADTESEIKAFIENDTAYTKKHLKSPEGGISINGSIEFWSSGGLAQFIPKNPVEQKFKSFSLTAKHIQVITLEDNKSAVAMYYSEGSFHPDGSSAVPHYMTRVTQVFVKEGGKWKVRAAHYSPIAGGQGTSQSALD